MSQGVSYPGGTSVFDFNGANSFNFRVLNSKFSSYNMDRPLGPVSGSTYVDRYRGAATSRGGLTLRSAGTATFRAYIPRQG